MYRALINPVESSTKHIIPVTYRTSLEVSNQKKEVAGKRTFSIFCKIYVWKYQLKMIHKFFW